jgi:hypothetical protein
MQGTAGELFSEQRQRRFRHFWRGQAVLHILRLEAEEKVSGGRCDRDAVGPVGGGDGV